MLVDKVYIIWISYKCLQLFFSNNSVSLSDLAMAGK